MTVTADNGDSLTIDLTVADTIETMEAAHKMIADRPTREHFSTRPQSPSWHGKVKPSPDEIG